MKSSSLAERIEEYESLEKLRLSAEPTTRLMVAHGAQCAVEPGAAPRSLVRRARRGGIVTRDTGLRPFRVG